MLFSAPSVRTVAGAGDGDSILGQVANRPPFKDRRDLAFTRPDRARDKLLGYSTLELKVVRARNLSEADLVSSDPYVEVCVDDVPKERTPTVFKNLNPVWEWQKTLEIKHPASVVLLRVMDYDLAGPHDLLGFVEFPVADLPLDTCTAGWFRLHPPEKLVGKAARRLERASETVEEVCGAVYVELTRKIQSRDVTDEQYAWCLPDPEPVDYPGYTRKSNLDAQALIDSIMDFKTALVGGFIGPFVTGVGYILRWRNVPMTSTVLAIFLGVSYRPELLASAIFLMAGLLLLMMSDPRVSSAMSLVPATVPLDDDGYSLIAQTRDTVAAAAYVRRVASALQGTIADQDNLHQFAAFSSYEGEAVAESYADLKRQIHKARAGTETVCPIVKADGKPLKKGALVQRSGQRGDLESSGSNRKQCRKGEVVRCENPDDVLAWRYEVRFDSDTEPEVVDADELDVRHDMRWLSGGAVQALIPNSLKDSLTGKTALFQRLTTTLKAVENRIRDIAGWKDRRRSFGVVLACLALSALFIWIQRALFIWIQRVFFFAVASLLLANSTTMLTSLSARRRGRAALKRQKAAEGVSKWGFFVGVGQDERVRRSSTSPVSYGQSFIDSARSMTRPRAVGPLPRFCMYVCQGDRPRADEGP